MATFAKLGDGLGLGLCRLYLAVRPKRQRRGRGSVEFGGECGLLGCYGVSRFVLC